VYGIGANPVSGRNWEITDFSGIPLLILLQSMRFFKINVNIERLLQEKTQNESTFKKSGANKNSILGWALKN
jgi:hypothetical protein